MQQINIRVEKETDNLMEYLARREKIPKALYVKQMLLENFTVKVLPILLSDYQAGKIGLKKILKLTSISPDELLDKIVELQIEPPITPEIDEYTRKVADEIVNRIKSKKKASLKKKETN